MECQDVLKLARIMETYEMNVKIFSIGVISLLSFAVLAVNNSSNVTVADGRIRATPPEKIVLDDVLGPGALAPAFLHADVDGV